jgi:nucleotide-binding universal stress UspA family protein
MTAVAGAPIVVGVDGSEDGTRAALLAASMAAKRNRPLRVVHAFPGGDPVYAADHATGQPPGPELLDQVQRIVADAVADTAKAEPGLAVSGEVIGGEPTPVLLDEAQRATITVLGSRGSGGFTGLNLGSVAVQVSAHAAGPVVIARGDLDRQGEVLVGVDGSPADETILAFAFEEASLRGVAITALHVHPHFPFGDSSAPWPADDRGDREAVEESEVLSEALAGWRERFPDVGVHPLLSHDRPARALIQATHEAGLLVVGPRGRGGFAGLMLGSVSQSVTHHADCPVAIVR